MASKKNLPNLEASLNEINSLIEQMEKGDLSLEKSLEHFERGVLLIKNAQKILTAAEQKVEILLKNQDNQDVLKNFESDSE